MSSIIHELTLLQEREGWLSEESLRDLAKRLNVPLHRVESVSTFYTHYLRTKPKPITLHVCRDLSCMLAGEVAATAALRERLSGRDDVEIHEVSCLGRCEMAPACQAGHNAVALSEIDAVLAELESAGEARPQPVSRWAADIYESADDHYSAFKSALGKDATELVDTLKESGLRGMGGAGFPTGLKWGFVSKEPATPRYVVCNADESEPGTFKDRVILNDLPHLVIEGMLFAALAVGSEKGWVFIRHEYEPERHALERAIKNAYAAGALGKNIFGSDFSFDVEVFVSPGGYILGEETALIECMEDRRGEPRNKPPFPGTKGLWDQPTLMNNVETFAHATGILKNGVDWWRALGKGDHAGHKFISVSGDVAQPGVHLIPMGSSIGDLLERCGGMKDGRKLAAVAPGGASSNFLGPDSLDIPMDFETLAEAGSMLGSGAAVFVAEGHNLLQVGVNVARFFRNESCGKCVPCRVGTEKAVRLIEAAGATPTVQVLDQLRELHATLARTSICGLGQVALAPLLSIVDRFPTDEPGG